MKQLECMDGSIENEDDLKKQYNPEGSALRKAQLKMLEMVVYLDKVCKENNITYFIEGGNLLGAIRHGGFIPWDDDFDIVVKKNDFKKLVKILKNNDSVFKLQDHETDKGHINFWAVLRDSKSRYIKNDISHLAKKYQGVQVDIFPFSCNVIRPFNRFISYFIIFNERYLVGRHKFLSELFYYIPKFIFIPLFRLFSFFIPKKTIGYDYGTIFTPKFSENRLFPCKKILFENVELSAPKDIDYYLKTEYGEDYMKIPNKTDRNHHSIVNIEFFD